MHGPINAKFVDYIVTFSSTEEFLSNCNSSFKIIRVSCSEIRHHTYIETVVLSGHACQGWVCCRSLAGVPCSNPAASWTRFLVCVCVVLISPPGQSTERGVPNLM